MRIVICDGCGKKLDKFGDYATLSFTTQRLDLCFERCYTHYEALLESEEELAHAIAKELADKRKVLVEEFQHRVTLGKDANGGTQDPNQNRP